MSPSREPSPRRRRDTAPDQRLPIEVTNERIERLQERPIALHNAPENLDLPLDRDIRVEGDRLELVVDGQAVSWATVALRRQRIRGVSVPMGAVGAVGTHDDHRFRGYSSRVMVNALRHIRHQGAEVSMLYGIPRFYPRFGYATAFPDVDCALATRNAETAAADRGLTFWDYAPEHRPAMVRLYQRHVADGTGPLERDAGAWSPLRKGLRFFTRSECRVALDGRGRLRAYLIRHLEYPSARYMEAICAEPALYPALLDEMVRVALAQRIETIHLHLSDADPLVRFCRPLGMTVQTVHHLDREGMVRLIRPEALMERLAPALEGRLDGTGAATIRTNLGAWTLRWEGGQVQVQTPADRRAPQARMAQWALARMVYGYCDASALTMTGDLKASQATVAALDRLFPETPRHLFSVDQF